MITELLDYIATGNMRLFNDWAEKNMNEPKLVKAFNLMTQTCNVKRNFDLRNTIIKMILEL